MDNNTYNYKKISSHTTGIPEEISRDDLLNHYQRVKDVILQYANFNGTFKALIRNHTGWWRVDRSAGTCRFFYPDEDGYDAVIKGCRTLYWTTQNFFQPTANIVEKYDKAERRPVKVIGTRKDMAYITFFLDLDIEDNYDIFNPEAKKLLEEGIKFFGKKLLDAGIESFGFAFSGNGAYCILHPQCGEVDENEKDREFAIKVIQRAFDFFIDAVANEFFEKHQGAEKYIRFDALNYCQKRQLKTICSIHKEFAHIVTPLDKYNPIIDLNEAKLPISDEIIEKSKNWLTYHEGDYNRMPELLKPYMAKAEEEEKGNKLSDYSNEHEPIIPDKVAPVESWAPCMKYIYNKVDWEGKGATRSLGVFASFLRMIGMPRTDALKIWQPKAQKWGVNDWERVFETLYDCKHGDGKLKCFVPTCEHIQRVGSGYPKLYLGGLGVCNPDARCRQIKHPLQYHKKKEEGEPVQIPLKYKEKNFGTLVIKHGKDKNLLISIESEDFPVAERLVPTDFYRSEWYRNRVFKHIKQELDEVGYEKFLQNISREIESNVEPIIKTEDEIGAITRIMDYLFTNYQFITFEDTEKVFYRINTGIYTPAEAIIKKEAEKFFGDDSTDYLIREIIGHVQRRTYIKRDDVNIDHNLLPMLNGLLNLKTFELEQFTEDSIFTYQVPKEYDESKKIPKPILDWITDIVGGEENVPLLQEHAGYLLEPRFPAHKTLWIGGNGRNGKGAFVRLLGKVIGKKNISHLPLEQMNPAYRFALFNLYGKLWNPISEPSTKYAFRTEVFKAITGGDEIAAEIKGKQDQIPFTVFAKIWIQGNKYPMPQDDTDAFWERVDVIKFPNQYKGDDVIPDIEEKLVKENGGEEALQGLFNWSLEGLKRLKKNNYQFSYSKTSAEKKLEFRKMSDTIGAFIAEDVLIEPGERYPQADLYAAYTTYCGENELEPQGKRNFTLRIGELRAVQLRTARYGKGATKCWMGLRLKSTDEKISFLDLLPMLPLLPKKPTSFILLTNERFKKYKNNDNIHISYIEERLAKFGNFGNKGNKIKNLTPGELNKYCISEGDGTCRKCEIHYENLWTVKIEEKEIGYCFSCIEAEMEKCIEAAIEQEREKKEREKQEKVGKKQKPTRELNLKDDRSEVDRIIGDRKDGPQEERKPVEITLDIADVKDQCQLCGYGKKWGVKLPYIVYYSKTDKSDFKSACKRCGEQIMRDYNLKLSGDKNE